jgi:hypothetical protein
MDIAVILATVQMGEECGGAGQSFSFFSDECRN